MTFDLRLSKMIAPIAESPLGIRLMRIPRFWAAARHFGHACAKVPTWLFRSRERTNFTYDYVSLGQTAAYDFISVVTGCPLQTIAAFAEELAADAELGNWLSVQVSTSPYRFSSDSDIRLGRRMLYYLIVRATKPAIVIEAGTDKGLGACLIAKALQRNVREGFPGHLHALDLRGDRGLLLGNRFIDVADLHICDSVEFIRAFEEKIDFFIHDTTTEPSHERLQYGALESKLAANGIVMSTWFTEEFAAFSRRSGRRFLLFPEIPANHWYPGGRIPFAFVPEHCSVDCV